MIKALIFFVLGAASIIFLIRAFVNTDANRVSRIVKVIIISLIVFGIVFFLARGNLGFLAPVFGIFRRLLAGF
tara:strand:- start:1062 stop:1280 length:219 start_codon:yes stop_codon:yes gene_type:complete